MDVVEKWEYDRWREFPEKMTPEEAIAALRALSNVTDIEVSHSQADEVLCSLLRFLGHEDVADAFTKLDKWYA